MARPVLSDEQKQKVRTSIAAGKHVDLFTSLHVGASGNVEIGRVVSLWQDNGHSQGQQVLQHLKLDGSEQISSTQLSEALEKAALDIEPADASALATFVAYRHEVIRLSSERNELKKEELKLRQDLKEAGRKIETLILEAEETAALVGNEREEEVMKLLYKIRASYASVEKKYQQEIGVLQSKLAQRKQEELPREDRERPKVNHGELDEGVRGRQHGQAHQEVRRLQAEVIDLRERYVVMDKRNQRLQRELQSAVKFHDQFEHLEANRLHVHADQQRTTHEQIYFLENKNREMRDRIDEMSALVGDLKAEIQSLRGKMAAQHPAIDTRLSDAERAQYEQDIADLKKHHAQENRRMEDLFNAEIEKMQGKNLEEKEKMIQAFNYEKGLLEEGMYVELAGKLQDSRNQMQKLYERERQDLLIKHDNDKALIRKQSEERELKMVKRLREEFAADITGRIKKIRTDYNVQADDTAAQRADEDNTVPKLLEEKATLELKLKLKSEEMQLEYEKRLAEVLEEQARKRLEQEEKHRIDLLHFENILTLGEKGLRGQLKEDFYKLLEKHKEECKAEEVRKQDVVYMKEKDALKQKMIDDKEEMESRHRQQLEELRTKVLAQLADSNALLQKERDDSDRDRKHVQETMFADLRSFITEKDALRAKLAIDLDNAIKEKENYRKENNRLMEKLAELNGKLETEQRKRQVEELFEQKQQRHVEKIFEQKQQRHVEELFEQKQQRHVEELFEKRQQRELATTKQSILPELDQSARIQELVRAKQEADQRAAEERERTLFEQERAGREQRNCAEANLLLLRQHERHVDELRLLREHERHVEERSQHERHVEERSRLTLCNAELECVRLKLKGAELAHAQLIKEREESWNAQKRSLIEQIELNESKAIQAQTRLAVAESEHAKTVERLREQLSLMVEQIKLKDAEDKLTEADQRTRQLEMALEERALQTGKMLITTNDKHQARIRDLESEKNDLLRNFNATQEVLHAQAGQLQQELGKSAKNDLLLKDLYIENSQLIDSLRQVEERERAAVSRLVKVEDKCKSLMKVIEKVVPPDSR